MLREIFESELTYLVLSFALTVIIIAKFVWGKFVGSLQSKVDSIRLSINNLERQKREAAKQIEKLKLEIIEHTKLAEKKVADAQNEAQKISEKYSKIIEEVLNKKQEEYKETVAKIKAGLFAHMQNKIIKLIEQEITHKLRSSKDNRKIQNTGINNSIKLIEDWLEK